MSRSVKVNLEVDATRYIPVVKGATKETKDLDDKVEGLDRSLGKTAAEFKTVTYEAGKLGVTLLGAGKEAGTAARKTDELGDQMGQLNRKILETTAALKLLALAYAATGDESVKADIKRQQSALNELKRIQRILTPSPEPGPSPVPRAVRAGAGLFQAIPFNPQTVAAVGGAAALTSPFWGGALGGATIAGGAVAAAAAGVGGAVMGDPAKFQNAWSVAIESIKKEWVDASAGFAGPTLEAITELQHAVDSLNLDETLGEAAKFVKPIVDGLSGFVTNIGMGVSALVEHAGPVVDVLAEQLPELGRAVKEAFDSIAGGSEGGALALRDLLTVIAATIVATGKFVGGLEHAYEGLVKLRKAVPGDVWGDDKAKAYGQTLDDLGAHLNDVTDKSQDTGKGMSRLGVETTTAGTAAEQAGRGFSRVNEQLEVTGTTTVKAAADYGFLAKAVYNTADAADAANEAFDRLFGEMMTVDEANLAVKEGFLQLKETLKENGRTLDDNTEKGQANRRGILEQIQVLEAKREADIAAGDGTLKGTQKANAAYQANLAELRKLLISLGYAPAAIDAIIGKYNELANIPDITKYVHINTVYRTSGTPAAGFSRVPGEAAGGYRHAAEGMYFPPTDPGTLLVGEPQTGGEWLIPRQGISQMRAAWLGQNAMSGYGMDVVPRGTTKVELSIAGGSDDWLYGAVRHGVRTGRVTLKVNGNRVTV